MNALSVGEDNLQELFKYTIIIIFSCRKGHFRTEPKRGSTVSYDCLTQYFATDPPASPNFGSLFQLQ